MAMIVTKVGDSLYVTLPAEEVARLGLKEGDEVEVEVRRAGEPAPRKPSPDGSYPPLITDPAERKAAIERLRRFEGMMPADYKFDREEANER
jgi:antitoxin MazE